ncbi:hypothetical protein FBQ82_04780 [Anaerolineae bacterium CFX7]|nr:hypothetical protein [Anaerolineae bacterium CFX7]
MITRLTISLSQDERDALQALAENERRPLRDQAALIIRRTLQRRGLVARERIHVPTKPPRAAKELQT